MRNAISFDRVVEGRPNHAFSELAPERAVQFQTPGSDLFAQARRTIGGWLVAEIIAIAIESVDSAHGIPLMLIEKQEGIIEVLGARPCHLPAILIGLFYRKRHQLHM